MTPVLELDGVSLAFGGLQAVEDLDIAVAEGEIVSLIGPNGAGKTTVFNLITGVYRPDTGDIRLGGRSLVGELRTASPRWGSRGRSRRCASSRT